MNISLKRAALAALVLESMMLSALAFVPDTPVQKKKVTMITLATVPEPEKAQPEKAQPEHKVVHKVTHKANPERMKQVAENEPSPVVKTPEPMPEKKAPATPDKQEPVQQEQVPSEITPSFRGEVRAAVQAAVVYPMAARMAHMTGRVRVGFFYLDGVPSGAKIIVSSGNGMLDRAALAAVMAASYPRPDRDFQGKKLEFELWVRFYGNQR